MKGGDKNMEENSSESTQKNSFPVIPVVIVAVIVVGGLFFVLSKNSAKTSESMSQEPQAQKQVEGANTQPSPSEAMMPASDSASPSEAMTGSEKDITVKGQDFSFTPSEIKVKKGDHVKITFQNTGGFHDFVLDEFNVKTKNIPAGSTDTVEFTADKVGTYEYYCSFGNHRQMGMKGNLIVE